MAGVTVELEKHLPFVTLRARAVKVGEDFAILIEGGEPHIGSAVLTVPRASLEDETKTSSTSSVLNVTGHKDEEVLRVVSERLCAAKNATVVCSGGVHIEGISQDQITQIISAAHEIADEIVLKLL